MVNIFKGFNFLVKLSLSPGHYCLQKNQQKKKKNILLNSEVIREFCQFHISSYSPTTAILLPFQGQLFTFIQKLIHLLVFFFCGR